MGGAGLGFQWEELADLPCDVTPVFLQSSTCTSEVFLAATSRLLLRPVSFSILLSPCLHAHSDIPRLRDSHFASSPLQSNPSPTRSLFFPFEVCLSGDEKQLLVRPPPPPALGSSPVYLTAFLLSAGPARPPPSFIYIEGRESEIDRRSMELFKQNANGLLMDPHFFPSSSLFLLEARPGGWLAKCWIDSDTGVRLCGETKPQLGATCPSPSSKVWLIYTEREGCLNH